MTKPMTSTNRRSVMPSDRTIMSGVQRLFRESATTLDGIRDSAADQRRLLETTASYRAAQANEDARSTCRAWDMAGTCGLVEDGIEELIDLLRGAPPKRQRPRRPRRRRGVRHRG